MRLRQIRVQMTRNRNMRSFLQALALVAMMGQTVAQTDSAFTRAEPCAADDGIIGYSTIEALNLDMEDELSRIDGGGAVPTTDYIMTLCPGSISVESDPLRPILDRVVFMCTDGTECAIDGSTQQVLIQDSAATGYTITSITFMGVTFSGFNEGVSSSVEATEPTVVSYVNSNWQKFNSLSIINVETDATVQIVNGEIGTTDGSADDAQAESFFINNGGTLEVDGLLIRTSIATEFVFENEGDLFINSARLNGVATPTVVTSTSGSVTIDLMVVRDSTLLNDMFLVENSGSTMVINRLSMINNDSTAAWDGIRAAQGAEATVRNSYIEENTNMRYGIAALATNADVPRVNVEGVVFSENTANPAEAVTALVSSIGNDEDISRVAFADVLRVDFIGNSGFTTNIFALFGGQFGFSESCFDGNTGQLFTVFAGKGAVGFEALNNHVGLTEESQACNGADGVPDLRVFQESESANCFNGECLGACENGADNSEICLSNNVRTDTPSVVPSAAPSSQPTTGSPTSSPTNAPSRVPTGSPSTSTTPTESPTVSAAPSAAQTLPPTVSPTGFPTTSTPSSPPSTSAPTITASPTVVFSLSPTGDIVTVPPKPDGPDCPPFFQRKGKDKGRGRGYHGSGAYYDRNGCEIAPPRSPSNKGKKSKKGSDSKSSKKLSASGKKTSSKSSKKMGKKRYRSITKPRRPSVPSGGFTLSLGNLKLHNRYWSGRRDLLVKDDKDEREEAAEWKDEGLGPFNENDRSYVR